ncbi:M23 family metallopeptidase [Phenylobacterium sp.]|uniref:M23 family metallopeptidase n=1 Tax=Phenylobacterium sp. TaxID=1871053 RepID=UPI00391ACC9E
MRMVLGALAAVLLAGAATTSRAAEPSVVPLDVLVPARATPVQGAGRLHLLYELRLTNFAPRPVTLEALEALAPSGAVMAAFDAAALKGMVSHRGAQPAEGAELIVPAGGFVTVFMDVESAPGQAPAKLSHRIRVRATAPDAPASRTTAQAGEVATEGAPLMLGPPLRGVGWVAANALSNESDHRRTIAVVDGKARISQRYAIDFVQLDAQGRAFRGDLARNESWTGYGADLLAVADGTVVAVKDDLPDNTPGQAPAVPISLATVGGNHVVLDIGGGAYAFYGHIRPGGVLVKPGQKVRRGEVVGKLGNSGQSDAPHLHLHVSDGVTALGGDGLAYAFEAMAVRGTVPSLEVLERPEGWTGMAAARPKPVAGELPTAGAVVDFAP